MVKDWSDTVVGPRPINVQEATTAMLRVDNVDSSQAFQQDCTTVTTDISEAATAFAVKKAIGKWSEDNVKLNKRQIEELFDKTFDTINRGNTWYAKPKNGKRGEYIKLAVAA